MAAHNKKVASRTMTKSKDGVKAFQHSPMQELCDRVLTSYFGEDRFYESGSASNSKIDQLIAEVAAVDPEFVAKLAVLAREKFFLRSTPQSIAVGLSRVHRGDSLVSKVVERICQRADDMSNIVACAISTSDSLEQVKDVKSGMTRNAKKKIPNQIKKGLAMAFPKFDEYQLQKHPKSLAVQPKDVFNLVHPAAKDEAQVEMWQRMKAGELKVAQTRETAMSEAGQKAAAEAGGDAAKKAELAKEFKAQGFEELIMNRKMGYLAVLRNIVKFLEVGLSKEASEMAQSFLANEKACANSKVFPHQIYTAYMEVANRAGSNDPFARKGWMKALNTALYNSVKNVPKLKGNTAILVDRSGSMDTRLSGHSIIRCSDISCVLGAMAPHYCENSITIPFGQTFEILDTSEVSTDILADAQKIVNARVGHSTNADAVIKHLLDNRIKVDNIQIFTDCQFNGSAWAGRAGYKQYLAQYRATINPDVVVYEVNLAGYGNTQTDPQNANNVFMSGWSDASLKYMSEFQDLKNGIVDMVNAVEL